MLITKEVEVTCKPANKEILISKGYNWESNKVIKVKTEDLTEYSKVNIKVLCDYCLEENKETIIEKLYSSYYRDNINAIIHKDSCQSCVPLKRKESLLKTYNLENSNQVYSSKSKDINKFNELFLEKGVLPLVTKYNSEKELLPFKCVKHDIVVFKSISRLKKIFIICEKCMAEYRNNVFKTEQDIVIEEFKNNGLIVLENEIYLNYSTPLKCYCIYHPDNIQEINRNQANRKYHGCTFCKEDMKLAENNPNWKGGITSESQKIRASEQYINWRNSIFERDKYTCQCCGDNKGGNLQAHHLENFSSNEELRFDIDNGITLCDLCHNPNKHGSFHNLYGTYDNTPEQLYEYIQRYKNGEFDELRKLKL